LHLCSALLVAWGCAGLRRILHSSLGDSQGAHTDLSVRLGLIPAIPVPWIVYPRGRARVCGAPDASLTAGYSVGLPLRSCITFASAESVGPEVPAPASPRRVTLWSGQPLPI
jgi:hypothetical protein